MGSWDFGNTTTLNTAALRAFVDRPDWRCEALARENLTPPCELPCDEISERLIAEQARHADRARRLMQADDRLGYHPEDSLCNACCHAPAKRQADSPGFPGKLGYPVNCSAMASAAWTRFLPASLAR